MIRSFRRDIVTKDRTSISEITDWSTFTPSPRKRAELATFMSLSSTECMCWLIPVTGTIVPQEDLGHSYDDTNRRCVVLDPDVNRVEYHSEAVGNMAQVLRSTAVPESRGIVHVTPRNPGTGKQVIIYGRGRNPTASDNTMFGGLPATVVRAGTTEVAVKIPSGNASSGGYEYLRINVVLETDRPLKEVSLGLVPSPMSPFGALFPSASMAMMLRVAL